MSLSSIREIISKWNLSDSPDRNVDNKLIVNENARSKKSKQKKDIDKKSKSASTNNKTAKAKRKREEEERKRREEEEARVRAELAEKERIETEKRLAEEKATLAKEINELRRRELAEFYEFIQPRIDQANATRHKQRDEFKWKRVMQCDGTPDPTSVLEINTFMSLWRDEHQRTNLEYTMKQTNLVLSLIKELNTVISSIPKDSSELQSIPTYNKTIHELEDLLNYKWRQAQHDIMLKATDLQDFETSNFQYFSENENVAICIWANLSHNPRIKGYLFEQNGFGFDLPKPLTLAHIAILGFFLKYDYYSERSLLAKCRIRSMEYTYDPIPEPLVDEPAKQVTNDDDDHEPIDPTLPAEIRKLMEQSRRHEKEAAAAAAAAEAQALQEAAAAQGAQENAEESQDGTISPTALNRKKSIRDVTADLILEELADESVVDLRSHWPILPLLEITLSNIPPQPKKVQEWNIVQVDDTDVLIPYIYPSDPGLPKRFYEEYVSLSKMEAAKTKADEKTDDPMDPSMTFDATIIANNPEIKRMFLANAIKQESALVFKYKIPSEIFVTDKPLLARWITDRNHWKQEGYVDYEYTSDTRMISFKTYDFGTFALLTDRHAHMPFQSWRMRPKSPGSVLFSLTTQSFEIMFEIRYDKVAVYLPPRKVEVVEEKPASMFAPKSTKPAAPQPVEEGEHIYKAYPAFVTVIEPIVNQFMPLKELITKLRSLGLNVFPEPDSDSYVNTINKNHKLEWLAYNQMAIVSSCTAFSYSHWNAFVNDEMRIVVGCKEHLTDKSTAEEDMKCIVFNNELVGFTDVSESSQEFVVASTFTDYHAELFHLVRERFSPAAFVRVMDAHPLFVETVNQLLMSIKPLTYA